MRQAVEHHGRPASPGLAAGPLGFLDRPRQPRRASGDPSRERADLEAAIAGAIEAIRALADVAGGDAADILEFQVAMLEDEALTAPALDRIGAGLTYATAQLTRATRTDGTADATDDSGD